MIYLTPSHQYPTGAALSLARRLALLALADRQQAWIVEDDYDSEFHYDGLPIPAMQGLDRRGRVLYLGTFSKSLFPSLRLAYLIVPPTLVDAFVTARTVYDGHSAQLMQAVTAEFIRQGTLPRISATCASSTAAGAMRCWRKFTKNSATSPRPLPPPAACSSASGCRPARRRRSADRRSGSASSRPLTAQYQTAQTQRDGWLLGFSALTPGEIRSAVERLAQIAVA